MSTITSYLNLCYVQDTEAKVPEEQSTHISQKLLLILNLLELIRQIKYMSNSVYRHIP